MDNSSTCLKQRGNESKGRRIDGEMKNASRAPLKSLVASCGHVAALR